MNQCPEQGFTLIEALVALMIAATAMVAMMGRLGASADTQQTLSIHELALEAARNKMAEISMQRLSGDEQQGSIEIGHMSMQWRSWTEKTEVDGFIRQNVSVTADNEAPVSLFLYRSLQQ